jgi:hypothetical protein
MNALRQTLADSYIAAVTIAVLVLWALGSICRGLWESLHDYGAFVLEAIAIWGIPYISPKPTLTRQLMLIFTVYFLYSAIVCVSAASLLSRWVYGMGPLRSLAACRTRLLGRRDA